MSSVTRSGNRSSRPSAERELDDEVLAFDIPKFKQPLQERIEVDAVLRSLGAGSQYTDAVELSGLLRTWHLWPCGRRRSRREG